MVGWHRLSIAKTGPIIQKMGGQLLLRATNKNKEKTEKAE
ncbi:hypothetical protein GEOBRER4_n0205 [Citrifermentans bremense]|uniref:Uncharacterized protein n=1 Tax=Citrifermentans bremense TaxID=60035 RepID=A0A7R7FRS5_9BACT|nr:hypothetical protein GEOBRER4_n0205 [Citrifermentans bremense]